MKIKKRQHPFWHLWASCFFCALLIIKKNINLLEDQILIQWAQWLQRRRLKCKRKRKKDWLKNKFSTYIQKQTTPFFFTPLGLLFLLCTSDRQNKKFLRGTSNEHSYKIWFKLAQWFHRRRLKCKSLWTTTDAKWWQYLTWPFGSSELKSYFV